MRRRRFVVISGLPGSGKTTIGRALAPLLHLALLDKDDILEQLYETRGVGDSGWRQGLSREADVALEHDTTASDGAVVVSFWRAAGMPDDSGTPTGWLRALSEQIAHLHCVCDPDIAARRFITRSRHPGHMDDARSADDVIASIRTLATLPPPDFGPRIDVDTSIATDVETLARIVNDTWPNLRLSC
jgi:AAA domain-containing protein